MLQIFSYLLFQSFYNKLNNTYHRFLNNKYNLKDNDLKKLAINSTSATHTLISLTLAIYYYFTNNINILFLSKKISIQYFIFDLINILSSEKYKINDLIFLFHHINTIYCLNFININNINLSRTIYDSLFFGEISNIPYFFIYFFIKTKKNPILIKKCKIIQKYLYIFIRGFIASYLYYILISYNLSIMDYIVLTNIYIFGLIFTGILLFTKV